MEPQINIITLGVRNKEKMTEWYTEKFGWTPCRDSDGTVFFRLENLLLVLVHEDAMAKDMRIWQDGEGFKRFSLTMTFNSAKEVDKAFEELKKKEVMIIKGPEKNNGIYKAYIADPEDNYWELACYPFAGKDLSLIKDYHEQYE